MQNNGFLIIDKEKGINCTKICSIIKKRFNTKVGHLGTLDPNTTGVLIVALGKATKLLNLITDTNKVYEAEIIFGIKTTSYDICGEILDRKDVNFTNKDLYEKVDFLSKRKTQLPPIISAVKISGKKLYDYFYENKEVVLKERNVNVNSYKITRDLYKNQSGDLLFNITLDVSKGYYVRSFAHDLGILLNTYATLYNLRRIKSGNITINEAKKLDNIVENDIIKIDNFFDFQKVVVSNRIVNFIKNGVTLYDYNVSKDFKTKVIDINKEMILVDENNNNLAIYKKISINNFRPIFIF